MTEIRAAVAGDLPGVVQLFLRAFRKDPNQSIDEMERYFRRLYFENPWVNEATPSIVAVEADAITGFMGVVPLPVQLDGRSLRVAVGGNLMVDTDRGDPMAAMRIMRRYLGGGHDLAITDTANVAALRLWMSLGASVARLQTMRWLLPLRPARLGLLALQRRRATSPLSWIGRPVASPVDRVLARKMTSGDDSLQAQTAAVSRVRSFTSVVGAKGYLHLDAQLEEWEWLIDMCRTKQQYGPLQLEAYLDHTGRDVGVAAYYPSRGNIGQVVLLLALDGYHDAVLSSMCRQASRNGCAALMGQGDPRLFIGLGSRASGYVQRNEFVVAHSSEAGLAAQATRGDVTLNRLVGEWWTRMQGDTF